MNPTFLDGLHDPYDQLRLHTYARTLARVSDGHRRNDQIIDLAGLRQRQAEIANYAHRVVGGWPEPGPAPAVQRVATRSLPGFEIDAIVLGDDVTGRITAWDYLPSLAASSGPSGAVLVLPGHSPHGKAADSYQGLCHRLAGNGLRVLAIDAMGHGERVNYLGSERDWLVDRPSGEPVRGLAEDVMQHCYAGLQCWWIGDTIARYFVADACHGLDYLSHLDEVDPTRIGVVGNSGGGTQTTWLMMGERRIAAAAVGSFLTSRTSYLWTGGAQDLEQILPGGSESGIDHEDFLLAMAPRPTLILSASDDFFPYEGTRDSVARARRYFALAGGEEQLRHRVVSADHGLHVDLAQAATEFFVRHLADRSATDLAVQVVPAGSLLASTNGQLKLDFPASPEIFDHNLARYRQRVDRERRAVPNAGRAWLSEQVFASREPAEFFPRWGATSAETGARLVSWWSEPGLLNAGWHWAQADAEATGTTVIAVFDQGSSDLSQHQDRIKGWLADGWKVLTLDVRGVGLVGQRAINPFPDEEFYGSIYKLMTDLSWLGDSLAAARVYDVIRAIDLVSTTQRFQTSSVRLFGTGHGGYYAMLAAAIDERVSDFTYSGELFDPHQVVSTRLYQPGRDLQLVIPGLPIHFPLAAILDALPRRGKLAQQH